MDVAQLLALIQSGVKLSPEQQTQALAILKGLGSGKVPEGAKSQFGTNYNAFQQALTTGLQEAAGTPQGKSFINMIVRERQADRFVRQYKPFFNAVIQGADIATSISQIREGNKASAALTPPGRPTPPSIDPTLNQSIYDASRGTFDSERALAPARQELRDAYNQDIQNARIASGGQAGAFGALANSANLRRMRGATGLPLIADQIRAREQARLDNLIAQRGAFNQQGFENRLGLYDRSMTQYNADVAAAGELGSTGRTNLRNTLTTVPDNFLGAAGRLLPIPPNPYEDIERTSASVYNPSISAYGDLVTKSLANAQARTQKRGINQQIYNPYTRPNF